MKKWIFILLAVLLAAGGGYFYFSGSDAPQYTFRTVPLERGDIVATVTATGKLGAVTVVDVGTQVSGTIREIYADFNDRVKKGQLIALIDPSVLEARLQEAEANLSMARASLSRARASVMESSRNLKRYQELWDRQFIAKSELDLARTTSLTDQATVREAEARVRQVEAALRQARTNLGYTKIISPEDGVVISREVNVGQTVAASLSTPTLFSIAKDLSDMQIETSVDEADISRVKEGQEVEFTVDAYSGTTFYGRVKQVRIAPNVIDNVVTYPVIISAANPELKLKPGMTANVSIITARPAGILKVPMGALRFTPPPVAAAPGAEPKKNGSSPLVPVRRRSTGAKVPGQEKDNAVREGTLSTVWVVEDDVLKEKVSFWAGAGDGTSVEALPPTELREGDLVAVSYSEKPKQSFWSRIGL